MGEMLKKILLVDESENDAELIERELKKARFSVVTARTTADLENTVGAVRPDLILMDVNMSGRNGFKACRDLTTHPDLSHIPVVLCTSKAEPVDRFWGQQQGASGHIAKPVHSEELMQVVLRLLFLT